MIYVKLLMLRVASLLINILKYTLPFALLVGSHSRGLVRYRLAKLVAAVISEAYNYNCSNKLRLLQLVVSYY